MNQPNRTKTYIARKKAVPMISEKVQQEMTVNTLEGPRTAYVGDYLMTGTRGEQWAIEPDKFEETYDVLGQTPDGKLQVQSKPAERAIFQTFVPMDFIIRGENFHAEAGDVIVRYGPDDMAPVKQDVFYETYEVIRPATSEEDFGVAAV
ncbi:MAG: PGDYG domain-containing protein [Anaerolineae bacterium]|nr:PGDYG domain-containing protein [Anaerolineae bacterium]